MSHTLAELPTGEFRRGAGDQGVRLSSLPARAATHPVQVPHAALFFVILLQGPIAVKLPGHTQRQRTKPYLS